MKRLLLVAVLQVLACKTPQATGPSGEPSKPKGPIRISLVGTNDVHGWVAPQVEKFPGGDIRVGGVANLAAYLKVLRSDNPGGVVLVDAGDMFQGTLLSNLSEGAAVIDGFNLLRYDAAAVGNHEFDYGPVGPISAATQGSMDPFGALKARIAQAKFPILSTNIYERGSGLRPKWLPGDGTVLIERQGVKIGIIGLTTPQTPSTTLPINVASLKFAQLAPEALTAAKSLRERGADLVVAVVHAGGKCADVDHAHDVSSCDLDSAEIFTMVRGLPAGTLDAVVAGHTHTQLAHFVNGTPIMQSLALGRYFGLMELYVDPATKHVISDMTQIHAAISICETVDVATQGCDTKTLRAKPELVKATLATFRGQPIASDATVASALQPAEQKVAELQNRSLGLEVPETLGRNYESESALGSFLADAFREMEGADIAMLNPGGLRADLKRGQLSYGAVYEVLPFDNAIATIDLTGAQLKQLLDAAFGSKKGVFQVSGLEVKLGQCPSAHRLMDATIAGKRIEPAKIYRVVMPDFLARGGDGLGPVLATIEPKQVNLGESRDSNLRDALVDHWAKTKPSFAAPKPGRVTFADDGVTCAAGSNVDAQPRTP